MDAAQPCALPGFFLRVVLCASLAFIVCGCGGGSSSTPPPVSPDFTLAVSPATVTIPPGTGAPVGVSVVALNGFASQVSVNVTGLPSGVSATPATFTLAPGASQNIILSASTSASATTATATFTGTAGSLSHMARVSVSIAPVTAGTLPSRTRYVRSDAVTEYGYSLNTHWEVFHSPTSRFFVTDPDSNQVFVFDSATEAEIGSMVVPGAYGIDQSADQSTLYVGTLIGDVYTIDPVAMRVTHRYLASQIGPYGYHASIALPLANGSVALLGAAGGIPSVDGSSSFAVWNPSTNSITIYGAAQANSIPLSSCGQLGNIGGFALTADRTTVILGSIDSDSTLCEINATTGQGAFINTQSSFIYKIVISPDGNYLAFPLYPGQVELFNAHTLAKVNQFAVAGDTSSASNLVFSADSQILFVPNDTTVYAYSTTTGQLIGWLPNITVESSTGGSNVGPASNPNYEVSDGTGLLVGPMEEGFGFLDTTKLQTGPVDSSFTNAYLVPATGPSSGGTQVQWSLPNATGSFNPTVYFGGNQASSASVSSQTATVTTPAGNPGPVPIYLFAPDGGMQLVPDGFSYGPSILEVTPNASTAGGGGTGVIYGYGFGPALATAIPANLSVTVGGVPATIVGYNGQAFNSEAPPFLLQAIDYTIPPGSSGSSVDVTVTSDSGTIVAPKALTYLPTPQQFPLAGSQLAQGIYDPTRDLYYFTDSDRIQVFSRTQGQWLASINIPAPGGAIQRLWGIAISPDGSKLAVTDAQADVIYLLNPANTSSIRTFAGPSQSGVTESPAGIAISDTGIAYFTVAIQGVSSGNGFYKLDTNSGTLTTLGNSDPGLSSFEGQKDLYSRTEISSDNSHVFFNNDGFVFNIDTATDAVSPLTVDQGCCYGNYDLALSSGQTQFEASSYLYDTALNAQSSFVVNDREALDISYVYGVKFSPDGALLFQPSTNGIDVIDGHLGTLLGRIALPFALSTNYDSLVADNKDNILIAITGASGNGIAVVDLSSIAEPPPLPYAATLRHWNNAGSSGASWSHAKVGKRPFGIRVIPHITRLVFK